LKSDRGAAIHYTVDGTVPTPDPLYEQTIGWSAQPSCRGPAFQAGFTDSIPTQEIFIVGE